MNLNGVLSEDVKKKLRYLSKKCVQLSLSRYKLETMREEKLTLEEQLTELTSNNQHLK